MSVVLAPGREKRVQGGHPWVFATEVSAMRGEPAPGDVVDVLTSRGRFVGRGWVNPSSQILVRLLTRVQGETVDEAFFRHRIREALDYRDRFMNGAVAAEPCPMTGDPGPMAAVPGVMRADLADRAFRLVFAEADRLPGFIVDYFAGHIVFQTLSFGADRVKNTLVRLVLEEVAALGLPVRGCFERNDAPVREVEGLPLISGPYVPPGAAAGGPTAAPAVAAPAVVEPVTATPATVPPSASGPSAPAIRPATGPESGARSLVVTIREGPALLRVDLARGQKTGYFLDQCENRAAIAPYVRGARVLDGFCYTGGFSVAAALYGAAEVLGVDSSPEALALARENAALNGFGPPGSPAALNGFGPPGSPAAPGHAIVSFHEANVFDFLRQAASEDRTWDVILLDPPAFAKSRAALTGALRGYKEINLRAMKLLPPGGGGRDAARGDGGGEGGGVLITSSCSQHLSLDLFLEVLASAAADTRRHAQVIEVRSQARDHPFLPVAPETRYLKFVVLRVR